MKAITKEEIQRTAKDKCVCGHTRIQHFVGGDISDCDKCDCREFRRAERQAAAK